MSYRLDEESFNDMQFGIAFDFFVRNPQDDRFNSWYEYILEFNNLVGLVDYNDALKMHDVLSNLPSKDNQLWLLLLKRLEGLIEERRIRDVIKNWEESNQSVSIDRYFNEDLSFGDIDVNCIHLFKTTNDCYTISYNVYDGDGYFGDSIIGGMVKYDDMLKYFNGDYTVDVIMNKIHETYSLLYPKSSDEMRDINLSVLEYVFSNLNKKSS